MREPSGTSSTQIFHTAANGSHRAEALTLRASDGRALRATWWQGAEAGERSLFIIPALAASQRYLRFFASYLSQQGWGVLTFDYRGTGRSHDDPYDSAITLDDWINLDLPAAVAEVRRRARPRVIAAVAHSIGGQLFGQSPVRTLVDSAVLIAAQRGLPPLFRNAARRRLEYAYRVFPLVIRVFGYLPASRFTFPERCPGDAILQWIRWGRRRRFTDVHGVDVEARFADYRGRLMAVTISDDDHYAPPDAVEALTALYENASVTRHVVDPRDYGLDAVGHFGVFHPRVRRLWAYLAAWLAADTGPGR